MTHEGTDHSPIPEQDKSPLIKTTRIHTQQPRSRSTNESNCKLCSQPASLLCGGCKVVKYCCATCQKARWPTHRLECQDLKKGIIKKVELIPAKNGCPSYRRCECINALGKNKIMLTDNHTLDHGNCNGARCWMPQFELTRHKYAEFPKSPMECSRSQVYDVYGDILRSNRDYNAPDSKPGSLIDISHHLIFNTLVLLKFAGTAPWWWDHLAVAQCYEELICSPKKWKVGLPDWLKTSLDHQKSSQSGWFNLNKKEDYCGVEMIYEIAEDGTETILGAKILFCEGRIIWRNV